MPRTASLVATVLPMAAILTLAAIAAPAASLEACARVALLEPTDAAIVGQGRTAAWTLQGQPAARLQVSVELRDADGRMLSRLSGDQVTLDASGQATRALPWPDAPGPHDPLPVTTLVIVRE